MPWVPLVLVLIAAAFDLKSREIPDGIPAALLLWAIIATAFGLYPVSWLALLGGLAVSFGLGLTLFALGGLGGGDVKLLAALGAALGLPAIPGLLFWIALAGGVLAFLSLARGRRDLAYVPAIALGLVLQIVWRAVSPASAPFR